MARSRPFYVYTDRGQANYTTLDKAVAKARVIAADDGDSSMVWMDNKYGCLDVQPDGTVHLPVNTATSTHADDWRHMAHNANIALTEPDMPDTPRREPAEGSCPLCEAHPIIRSTLPGHPDVPTVACPNLNVEPAPAVYLERVRAEHAETQLDKIRRLLDGLPDRPGTSTYSIAVRKLPADIRAILDGEPT